jgi:hypothetical protein
MRFPACKLKCLYNKMRTSEFIKKIEFGDKGEKFAQQVIPHLDETPIKGYGVAQKGKFSPWDLWYEYEDGKTYYEVKRDTYTYRTNNICIEHHSDNIPSGISITEADYYFYIVDNEPTFYLIPVKLLKEHITENRYHSNYKVGYRQLSHCYFFDRKLYEEYEYEYDPMDFQQEA